MNEHEHDHDPDAPSLRLVPDSDADDGVAQDAGPPAEDVRDPLLARAEDIADLPLAERPAAFDGLNRALVAELNQLEEG